MLEAERFEALAAERARVLEAERRDQEARDHARAESVEAQRQEVAMMKAARSDVLAALVLAAELVPAMRQVAKAVSAACAPGPNGEPPMIEPRVAMGLLVRHGQMIQKAVGSLEAVIQLSRLERGEHTAKVALTAEAPREEMSMEDALEELAALEALLKSRPSPEPRTPLGLLTTPRGA